MNTHANPTPTAAFEPPHNAAQLSATRPFYWSVRRELWENRSVYLAPIGMSAVFLFGFLISSFTLPGRSRSAAAISPEKLRDMLVQPYDFAALLIMFVAFAVGLFYCLEALQGERRDRSIWFWKSLPVSDRIAVLAKASIAFLVLPLLTCAIVLVTQLIMLAWSSLVLLASGVSIAPLWTEVALPRRSVLLLYHMITVHMLWYAPIYAWLLLASAWARRLAFLWATLPLVAIGVIEKVAFNTTHFPAFIQTRFFSDPGVMVPGNALPMDPSAHIMPAAFLGNPGLWVGLALTAIFLAAAMRLRRYRGPA
jgi:ABC-2 type transport system permease protein